MLARRERRTWFIAAIVVAILFGAFWGMARLRQPITGESIVAQVDDLAPTPDAPPRAPEPARAAAPPAAAPAYAPNRLLVKFDASIDEARITALVEAVGARVTRSYRGTPGLKALTLPEGLSVPDAQAYFEQQSEVETVEPDYEYRANLVPNDPELAELWGLNNSGQSGGTAGVDIGALVAWEQTTGSRAVYIGVIDTGIDYRHADLGANVWTNPREIASNGIDDDGNGWVDDIRGIDPLANRLNPDIPDSDPIDEQGHGTHVAGTIAAVGDNGEQVVGVMWQASVIACRFLDAWGVGVTSDALSCLDYFATLKEQGIDVVATNNSWGGDPYSQLLYDAIARQRDHGILFVAAAGNEAIDQDAEPHYPAGYDLDNIISVAALAPDGRLASFSNFGANNVDIAAPGVDVLSTLPGNRIGHGSGTSMAAPHVTGVIGLLKTKFPDSAAADLKSWVLTTGTVTPELQGRVSSGARLRADIPMRDEDGDGMDDDWELSSGLDPTNPADATLDSDGDSLINLREFVARSNPQAADTDGDGLLDGAEVDIHGTNPAAADSDSDGLDDTEELSRGTDPRLADTDGDGLTDAAEIETALTNPLDPDSDDDGASDGWELEFALDPRDSQDGAEDNDSDGLTNAEEFAAGADPNRADSDGDGLADRAEVITHQTDPSAADSDGDGMPDGWEVGYNLAPRNSADALADPDNDTYRNLAEFRSTTDPTNSASAPTVGPWTTLGGGPSHAGHVLLDTRDTDFAPRWVAQFSSDNQANTVVTKAGRIFHTDLLPDSSRALASRSVADGSLVWRTTIPDGLPGAPAVGNGFVYTLVRTPGGYALYSLAETDGRIQYSAPIDLNHVSPVLTPHDGNVFLNGHDDDSNLVILSVDAATGTIDWQTTLEPSELRFRSLVVTDEYVADYEGPTFYVLDRDTGDLILRNTEAKCSSAEQVLFDGASSVYAYTPFCIAKYDLTARTLVWERELLGGVTGLSLDDRYLYASSYVSLRAIDPADGSQIWQWWVPDAVDALLVSHNVVSTLNHVVATTADDTFVLDSRTGALVWAHALGGLLSVSEDGGLVVSSPNMFTVISMTGDRDGDGMPDWWERYYGFDRASPADGNGDADADGLRNVDEYAARTNPVHADTDADGLADGPEVNAYSADPRVSDTDHDGLGDGEEVATGTAPAIRDSDGDGFTDYEEAVSFGTDPLSAALTPSPIASYLESFETGWPAAWQSAPPGAGWAITSDTASDGFRSLRADLAASSGVTEVVWDAATAAGRVTFDVRFSVSCCDELRVYVDDQPTLTIGGSSGWQSHSFHVRRGPHDIRWQFERRGGNGTVWIDNVRFEASPVFATNARHLLAVQGEQLHEFTTSGERAVYATPIPEASAATELVVLADHRIVISDALGLHFLDPPTGLFYRVPFEWGSDGTANIGGLAATDDYIVAANQGYVHGLVRFDLRGNFFDRQLVGIAYRDVTFGDDGFLYGLREETAFVDQIDPDDFSIVRSVRLGNARAIAVRAGSYYAASFGSCAGCLYSLVEYDSTGRELRSVAPLGPVADAAQPVDLDYLPGDVLAVGLWNRVSVTNADLDPPSFFATGGSGDVRMPTFVAHVPKTGPDGDGDGLPDWWERVHGLAPGDPLDAVGDPDADGLSNAAEFAADTDPRAADSDADGIDDGAEVNARGTDPVRPDTDDDGLFDGAEVLTFGTSPTNPDSDADGLSDGVEVSLHSTNPLAADTDADGVPDGYEVRQGFDPRDAADASQDPDADGLTNHEELTAGTDPANADSDFDAVADGMEVEIAFTNPLRRDTDGDSIWDDWEIANGFNPVDPSDAPLDADDDGFDNRTEYFAGTHAREADSIPVVRPWIARRGDAGHTGYVPLRLRPSEFTPYWRVDVVANDVTALDEVVAENGAVFVSSGRLFDISTWVALDGLTGQVRWRHTQARAGDTSPLALTAGRVFAQTAAPPMLWGVDRQTGVSEIQTALRESSVDLRITAPIPFRQRVYAGGGHLWGISAFDAVDGRQLWHTVLPGLHGGRQAAVDSNSIYLVMQNLADARTLYVLDRHSGVRRRTIVDPNPTQYDHITSQSSTVLGHREGVLAVQGAQLAKIDLAAPSASWVFPGAFDGTPAVANGVVYAVDNGRLVALSEDTGVERWRWLDAGVGRIAYDPLATVDHVFVSSATATYAIDTATRAAVWSFPHGGSLSLSNDRVLYIAGTYGDLQAIATFADSDHDGMADDWELQFGLNPAAASDGSSDLDSDGLANREEFMRQTQVSVPDTDGDGLEDGAEAGHHTDPLVGDSDRDGLSDAAEIVNHGTDANAEDTDEDGVSDGNEVLVYLTNPVAADTDADGINDRRELELGSDPLVASSQPPPTRMFRETFESGAMPLFWDNAADATRGWSVVPDAAGRVLRSHSIESFETAGFAWDGFFVEGDLSFDYRASSDHRGTLVLRVDEQEHVLNPFATWQTFTVHIGAGAHRLQWELRYELNQLDAAVTADIDNVVFAVFDGDSDGLPDAWERQHGLDPANADDADADNDSDGLVNRAEYTAGTLPRTADTDADGMPDGWEARFRFDPRDAADANRDFDGDGVSNVAEYRAGSDPTVAQSPSGGGGGSGGGSGGGGTGSGSGSAGSGGGGGGGAMDWMLVLILAVVAFARAAAHSRTFAARTATLVLLAGVASCSSESDPPSAATAPVQPLAAGSEPTPATGPPSLSTELGLPPSVPFATCPANSSIDVGINSLISVSVAEPLDAATVSADSVALSCNGAAVAGSASIDASSLTFAPLLTLPRNATCTASVAESVRTASGQTLASSSWSFTTASSEARWFRYDTPTSVFGTNSQAAHIRGFAAEGDLVALAWRLGIVLNVSTSQDGGRTFSTTPIRVANAEFGTVEETDVLIRDGVLHIAWRVLPESNAKIFYTRSTTDIGRLRPLTLIGEPGDRMDGYAPSIAVGAGGAAYVAWNRDCQFDDICATNDYGIFLDTIPADPGLPTTRVQLQVGANLYNPMIAWTGDHLVVAWMDFNREQIAVRRYDGTLTTIADISNTGQRPWLDTLRAAGNRALLFWGEGTFLRQHFGAAYDGTLGTLTPPTHLATTDNNYPRVAASAFAVGRDGTVAWVNGSGHVDGPFTRELALSEDGGAHFLAPQPLEFIDSNADEDLVPHIAVAGPVIYAAWQRHASQPMTYVTRGVPSTPCAPP